jgi:hypothetical protein
VPLATCKARRGKQEDDPNRQQLSVSEGSWRAVWDDFRNWLIQAA